AFAAFDDEPTIGKKPEPKPIKKAVVVKAKKKETKKEEKKKGFNWGKLAGNVLAAVAVVAVVAAVVAVVVFTGGTAIPAVAGALAAVGTTAGEAAGMAFAGGMIMGGIGVAGKAISDYASGVVSDLSSYTSIGARESFVGALSGAIFGPYGAFKSYKGMMALGGLTNGVESLIRQTLEGKGINFKTLLLDAGFGAATAGMFHGAGKLFQKASPFVKKAFNKVSSNISENTRIAKIALSNMEKGPKSVVLGSNFGNVDEALGRFTKEFKKVKSGIAEVEENGDILIQRHGTLKNNKDIIGQSHHLNQDAAFRDAIPREDGMAIKLEGNIFTDIGSPHYNAHKRMETFWNKYRNNGDLFGKNPAMVEYNKALYESLQNAGLNKEQSISAMRGAVKQQLDYGLTSKMDVPRIPGKINLK
ncbi:hypothetical protein, partial [Clostridium estertheticum]